MEVRKRKVRKGRVKEGNGREKERDGRRRRREKKGKTRKLIRNRRRGEVKKLKEREESERE